jgi:hypothetical protein
MAFIATGMRIPAVAAMIAAPAALLLTPGRAEAILTYNIFDSGPNQDTLRASGSLATPTSSAALSRCSPEGSLITSLVDLCTGDHGSLSKDLAIYTIAGPIVISPSVNITTTSVTGIPLRLRVGFFGIDPSYSSGSSIASSAIFNGTSLAALGFTVPSLIAFWQLLGVDGPDGRIELRAVPGPLPLFGAAAAFGWSRTLRRRISVSGSMLNA